MDTSTLEHEMLNCPDCQLQTLQQQAQQQHNSQLNQKHQHVSSSADIKDLGPSTSQPTRSSGSPYNSSSSHHSVPPDPRLHPTSSSSSDSTKVHHQQNLQYRNPPMPSHYNAAGSSCNTGQSLQLSSNSSLSSQLAPNPSSVAGPSGADMYPTGNLTPLPMEGCDMSGYCATCAVLDLPANDKYYRPPPLSRHSVFPSMFYSQPPPIPGFSPVPDCNLWSNSNDYGPYSYTSAYQQPGQSTPSDYYSNCNVLLSPQSHTEASSQIQQATSCSFFQSSLPSSTSPEEKKVNAVDKEASKTQFTKTVSSTRTREHANNPVCISSSSDETSDSESYISQREVIVEDDDDNDDASVSMSICNMGRNQRCVVCQISIMTDCSSPQLQLVNILENIHEDITAEDLDITVSSGDIEIGGIEDEVRDFQQPKKSAVCHITFVRLAYLLNIPVTVLSSVNEGSEDSTDVPEDQDLAPLCNKCGKLAGTVDVLEKQLSSNCIVLKQLLEAQMGTDFENKTVVNPVEVQIEKTESPSESISQKKCNNNDVVVKFASVETQTEDTRMDYTVPRNPASYIRQRDLPSPKNLINFRDIRLEYATDSARIGDDTAEKCYQSAEASMGNLNLSGGNTRFPCSLMTSTDPELEIIFPDVNSTTPESSDCSVWLPSSAEATEKHADHLCEECGQILACRRTFEVHMKRHHNQLRFQCTDCLKSFVTTGALKVHLRCHSGERPFVCIKCDKGFSTKSNLNVHSESCKETGECSNLKSRTLMADFQYNKSQNSDKFKCHHCGISFRLKYRFDVHVQKGCGSKSVECSHCQKKFTKQSELKVHMLTHDSKKPFACDTCGLSFATKGNLSAHMRIHSEEKRFKCHICDKGFNRKQALQLHVNRHNGLKPFSCEICNRKFSDPSNLQSHKKTHEKK